jgi:hypothetical protein
MVQFLGCTPKSGTAGVAIRENRFWAAAALGRVTYAVSYYPLVSRDSVFSPPRARTGFAKPPGFYRPLSSSIARTCKHLIEIIEKHYNF